MAVGDARMGTALAALWAMAEDRTSRPENNAKELARQIRAGEFKPTGNLRDVDPKTVHV